MFEYKNQSELYKGLIPALNVKVRNIKRMKNIEIRKEEIWEYLKLSKWKNSVDLTLADMVQDILHTDNYELITYQNKNKESLFKGV